MRGFVWSAELRECVLIIDKGRATQRRPSVSILLMSSVHRASQPLSATERDLRFISLRTIGDCVRADVCVFVPQRVSVCACLCALIKAGGS